jgi:hypothetical protein
MRVISSVALFLLMGAFASCIKKPGIPDIPIDTTPAITPVGIPVDLPVSKSIGAAGGSLLSGDGKLELNIPAGALSAATSISIQPVTNECPGGIGLSYHLKPDGITFNKPVAIVYRYTKEEINGSLPYLLFIAYQDESNRWKADCKKRLIDTVSKTLTFKTTHFSVWSIGDRIRLEPSPYDDEYFENDTRMIRAVISDPPEPTDDELVPLPRSQPLPDSRVKNWKVNGHAGNATDGRFEGSGATVTYRAPATIDRERTVQLSAEIDYEIVTFNNGQPVASVNKLVLFRDIKLLPSIFNFETKVRFRDSGVSTFIGQVYEDRAELYLTLAKQKDAQGMPVIIASAMNYVNHAPTVTPLTQSYPTPGGGTYTYTWIPDAIGQMNIVDIRVLSFDDSTVDIEFLHANTRTPAANWQSTLPALSGTIASQLFGGTAGVPSGFVVKLKRERQVFGTTGGVPMVELLPD